MEWQPIETAPKAKNLWDDSPSLVGKLPNGDVVEMKYHGEGNPSVWCERTNSRFKYLCWVSLNNEHQPTHWKPMESE